VVISLGGGADLHNGPVDATATQYLLLQLIQIGFTFLVPTHPGSPGQNPESCRPSTT